MNTCPLCEGTTITRVSSVGEETWCTSCRSILASATLDFKFAGGEPEACSRDGLPGYKGPGSNAKCYTYEPGDADAEKKAKARAGQSAYMEQRRMQSSKIVESIAFFTEAPSKIVEGIDYTEEDETKLASDPLQRIIPATVQTEDGVEVGNNQDVGSGVTQLASNFFHPTTGIQKDELESLGRAYCTNCGGDHEHGSPCN
jgi:hypothetical protein